MEVITSSGRKNLSSISNEKNIITTASNVKYKAKFEKRRSKNPRNDYLTKANGLAYPPHQSPKLANFPRSMGPPRGPATWRPALSRPRVAQNPSRHTRTSPPPRHTRPRATDGVPAPHCPQMLMDGGRLDGGGSTTAIAIRRTDARTEWGTA